MNIRQLVVAAAGVTLSTAALAQSAAPGVAKVDAALNYSLYPAGKVLGLDVMNASQKSVGDIGDLLVDPRTGEIRYAVLDVGGFLGVGEDHRIVPWSLVEIVADEKDIEKCHARTSLTEAQVKAAPKCKQSDKLDAALDKRIESSFGKDDSWAYMGKGEAQFAWCSEMDGVTLKDSAGKEVGKVKDLVLAPMNGCVAYVIVDTTKEAGGKNVALPVGRVEYSFDKDHKLMASTSTEMARFASAPEYDSKDWKRMSSTPWLTELSTYYSCDPFWKTTRFASAKKLPPTRN